MGEKEEDKADGDPGAPERTSDALESAKCACHANHAGTAAATQEHQGVHPTMWRRCNVLGQEAHV